MMTPVKLPELGENIEEAEVLAVLVAVGDRINKDQAVIEVETEKASVEVPSPVAGVVTAISVAPGELVHVGQPIVELDGDVGEAVAPVRPKRVERDNVVADARESLAPADSLATPSPERRTESENAASEPRALRPAAAEPAPAAPSVRRLARELGIDINDVVGRGPGGRIAADDVMRHARMLIGEKIEARRTTSSASAGLRELPDFTRYGPVERQPMSGVRRTTAQTMTRSWITIPHVTQFDRADITELERTRKHYAAHVEGAGSRLTLTAVVIKTAATAVTLFPKFNASIDADNDEIVYKKYVNIGVAVDTDQGLLVPVIRDVDKRNLIDIGRDLTELSARARARKSRPEDLRGANLTVTNLGGLGTTYFSPLIRWPEVAVLGVGRAREEAVYRDGAFEPRLILPLSVSYDHRLIDGADAARFLRWIAEALEHPLALALEG